MKTRTILISALSFFVAYANSGCSYSYLVKAASIEDAYLKQKNRSEMHLSLSAIAPAYESGKFSFSSLSVLENGNIWSVGYDGVNPSLLRHSTDEGKIWETFPISSGFALPSSLTFSDNLNGWVVGLNSVFNTSDGGKTWKQVQLNTEADFERVSFLNSKIGFIAGAVNIKGKTAVEIWMTKDGGQTWAFSYREPRNRHPYTLLAVSESVALAVFDANVFFRTDDGGKNWNKIDMFDDKGVNWEKSAADYDIKNLYLGPNNRLWAVGRDGVFYFSVDNGSSWNRPQKLPDNTKSTSWNSIRFFDNNLGIAVGQNGNMLTSSDGGDTWKEFHSNKIGPNEDLSRIQGNGTFGVIIGSNYIYKLEIDK